MSPNERLVGFVGAFLVFLAAYAIVGMGNLSLSPSSTAGQVIGGALTISNGSSVDNGSLIPQMPLPKTAVSASDNGKGKRVVSGLQSEEEEIPIPNYVENPGVRKWVVMDIDPSLFQKEKFTLKLPFSESPVELSLVQDKIEYSADNPGDFTWFGKLAGDDLSTAVIVWKESYVAATFLSSKENGGATVYYIYPYIEYKGIALEVDSPKFPFLMDLAIDPLTDQPGNEKSVADASSGVEISKPPTLVETTPITSTISFSPKGNSLSFQSTPTTIDVLVVYTQAAMNEFGYYSVQPIQAEISLWEALTNIALSTSQTNTQIRVVHTDLTPTYQESSSLHTDLSRLRNTSDGYMDEVHSKRTYYGADLVMLVTDTIDGGVLNPLCGLAYQLNHPSNQASLLARDAFGSVSVFGLCGNLPLLFSHELGHTLGMHHDLLTSNGTSGAFNYSHGKSVPNEFRTIMGYSCGTNCPWLAIYSNPSLSYNGTPAGSGSENNAKTLRTIVSGGIGQPGLTLAQKIASFMPTSTHPLSPPLPPSNLAATDGTLLNKVKLTWLPSSIATQYEVYRTAAQQTTQIGLTGNLFFVDTTAIPGTIYSYFVKGRNASGAGEKSNATSGYAVSGTSPPAPPTGLQLTALSQTELQLLWTRSTFPAVKRYQIYVTPGNSGTSCADLYATTGNEDSTILQGLSSGTPYSISIKSQSLHSTGPCSFVRVGYTTPASPSNIHATDGLPTLSLSWSAPFGGVLYRVYRSTTPAFQIDSTNQIWSGYTTSNVDTTAAPGVAYYYRVTASNSGGESPASPYTQGYSIGNPSPVSASDGIDPNQITVDYQQAVGAQAYVVYRNQTGQACQGTPFYDFIPPFLDTTALPGIPYYYSIQAYSPAGYSLCSNVDSGQR